MALSGGRTERPAPRRPRHACEQRRGRERSGRSPARGNPGSSAAPGTSSRRRTSPAGWRQPCPARSGARPPAGQQAFSPLPPSPVRPAPGPPVLPSLPARPVGNGPAAEGSLAGGGPAGSRPRWRTPLARAGSRPRSALGLRRKRRRAPAPWLGSPPASRSQRRRQVPGRRVGARQWGCGSEARGERGGGAARAGASPLPAQPRRASLPPAHPPGAFNPPSGKPDSIRGGLNRRAAVRGLGSLPPRRRQRCGGAEPPEGAGGSRPKPGGAVAARGWRYQGLN